MSQNVKAVGLALLAFLIFSTHDVFIKALGSTYSPFQIIFFTTLFAFPLSAFMLLNDKFVGDLRPLNPGWVWARTIAGVITGFSAFYAFSVLPLAQTYAILFAMPLLITVLSIPILGEHVGIHRWAAIVLGLIGIIIVLRPSPSSLTFGHAAALLAAVANSLASVIVRKIGREERPIVLMIYPMVLNMIVMSCIIGFVYKPMPFEDLALNACIAVFGFTAGLILIRAYRMGEAAVVAPMQYSQIIWAGVFGATLFDEVPDTATLIGTALVILSGLYIVYREQQVSKATPVLRTRSRHDGPSQMRLGAFLRNAETKER